MGPRFRVSSERLEKPGIKPTIPGLEGEQLNHNVIGAYKKEAYKKETKTIWQSSVQDFPNLNGLHGSRKIFLSFLVWFFV